MKFSIIVPIYNVEEYLNKCIESITGQPFDDYEVICVNDGSTDNSRVILTKWESKHSQIKVIDRENGGLSAARNTGLKAAQGDYVLFVDSDDWIDPSTLNRLEEECTDEDMICFACRRTNDDSYDRLPSEQSTGWDYYNRHALEARKVPFVCVWQRCYRREFLIENNLYFREGILHEDNEFTPRACLFAKSVKVIPDVLYNYRVRPGSIMTTRGLRSKESLIILSNELSKFFAKHEDINRTTIYQALTQCYQMAFIDNNKNEDHHLKQLIDWECYHRVSSTKIRHQLQFVTMQISPSFFRVINRLI